MTRAMGTISAPWAVAIGAFCTDQRAGGAPPTTLTTRRQHLEHLARRADVGPWEVTGPVLLEYVAAQTWAPATRASRRTTLRAFYRYAEGEGLVAASPATALPRVRPTPPNPRPLPDMHYRVAYAAATVRERLMLLLGAQHGMRRAEIAVVHSRDVFEDLAGWSITVHGKGGRERVVPLLEEVAVMLRGLPVGYAFPGRVEGHLSPRWVGRILADLLPGDWTAHALRHRAATRWWEASERDLFVVQELLGHASPVTTRAYVAVDTTRLRSTVRAAA